MTARIETGRPQQVDVLVVGSGPVGTAAAVEVVRRSPSARVLVLEVGPLLTERIGRNLKNVADIDERAKLQIRSQGPEAHSYGVSSLEDRRRSAPGRRADVLARPGTFLVEKDVAGDRAAAAQVLMRAAAMSSNVGGMGVHWTCASPSPYGAERTDAVPADELDAVLAEARSLLHVTQEAYPPNPIGSAVIAALTREYADVPAGRQPQPMPLAVDPSGERREWTGTETILTAAGDAADRIAIRPETLARRLLVDGDVVTGVEAEDRTTGERWTIATDAVLVAGDSFRTPQLLWASGVRPTALGHYLNDHTQVMGLAQVDLGGEPLPEPVGGEDPLIGVYWIPFSEAHPFHAQVMQLDLSPIDLRADAADGGDVPTVGIGLFVPKDIRFDDAVRFDDDALDAYGMPLMSVDYGMTAKDEAAIDAAKASLARSATAVGALSKQEPILLEPGSSLHYQGTVRMGVADDGTSVCDAEGRVWGFTNLYVGGNGVIPTPTAGNPTLTSVALVLRSARAIVRALPTGT